MAALTSRGSIPVSSNLDLTLPVKDYDRSFSFRQPVDSILRTLHVNAATRIGSIVLQPELQAP